MSFNNLGGLLGTAVGFVILAEGVKLLSDANKHVYQSKGHKIYPMVELDHHLKQGKKIISPKKGLIHQNYVPFPDFKINL